MTEAQKSAVPPVDHPIVRTHPETGRKCLFLGDHAEWITGMGYDEGRTVIDQLNERIIALAPIYTHRWRPRLACNSQPPGIPKRPASSSREPAIRSTRCSKQQRPTSRCLTSR